MAVSQEQTATTTRPRTPPPSAGLLSFPQRKLVLDAETMAALLVADGWTAVTEGVLCVGPVTEDEEDPGPPVASDEDDAPP